MMKKVLVIIGNGENGNTDQLSQSFVDGARFAGHEVRKIVLHHDIQGCKGCRACQHNGHQCVIKDDMQVIYPLFEESDVLVLASPLYFWSISGRLKSFIDRLYAISTNDEYPSKETILLMTSGCEEFYAFEQPVSYYRLLTNALGWNDRGMVLAYGCKGDPAHKWIDKKYLEKAFQLGKIL